MRFAEPLRATVSGLPVLDDVLELSKAPELFSRLYLVQGASVLPEHRDTGQECTDALPECKDALSENKGALLRDTGAHRCTSKSCKTI